MTNDKKAIAASLLGKADEARKNAYAPYSHYTVGAALLTASGKVYVGCNIENAAFTPTVCAERTAFFKAVSDGIKNFSAIAIVGGNENANGSELCAPCGVCRQVLSEFCEDGFEIFMRDGESIKSVTLSELLPHRFRLNPTK